MAIFFALFACFMACFGTFTLRFPGDESLVEGVSLFISITSSVILLTWHNEEDLKFDKIFKRCPNEEEAKHLFFMSTVKEIKDIKSAA